MKRNKAAPCGGGLILSQQRGQHPQNGAEEAAYPGVAEALLQRHWLRNCVLMKSRLMSSTVGSW